MSQILEKVYTAMNIGNRNDTTNMGPIWFLLRRTLVKEMIPFRVIWKQGIPFNVGKMLGNFGSIYKDKRKKTLRKRENNTDMSNAITYRCFEKIIGV